MARLVPTSRGLPDPGLCRQVTGRRAGGRRRSRNGDGADIRHRHSASIRTALRSASKLSRPPMRASPTRAQFGIVVSMSAALARAGSSRAASGPPSGRTKEDAVVRLRRRGPRDRRHRRRPGPPSSTRRGQKTAQPEVIVHQIYALFGLRSLRAVAEQVAVTNELRTKGTTTCWKPPPGGRPPVHRAELYRLENGAGPQPPGHHRVRSARPGPAPVDRADHGRDQAPRAGRARRCTRGAGTAATARSTATGLGLHAWRHEEAPDAGHRRTLGVFSFCEVTDAAAAAVAAVTRGAPGLYNIVDDDPAPVASGCPTCPSAWAASRLCAPRPGWAACWPARRPVAYDDLRAAARRTRRPRRELGWAPQYPSWRDGFRVWAKAYLAGHAQHAAA